VVCVRGLSRFALLVVAAVPVVSCDGPAPARVSLSESHTAPDQFVATATQPLPLRVAVAAIQRFFSATSFTHSHDNSIRAVADGTYDGAAVDSLVYDVAVQREPSLAGRIRIVHREGPFGMPPVVVRAGMDVQLKARLREVFLGIGDDEAASRVRQTLHVDRFVPADINAYASVRRMAAILRRWDAAP
jgi:phosphonate transport system substrate-binding protein